MEPSFKLKLDDIKPITHIEFHPSGVFKIFGFNGNIMNVRRDTNLSEILIYLGFTVDFISKDKMSDHIKALCDYSELNSKIIVFDLIANSIKERNFKEIIFV